MHIEGGYTTNGLLYWIQKDALAVSAIIVGWCANVLELMRFGGGACMLKLAPHLCLVPVHPRYEHYSVGSQRPCRH
jgi:hypothetical protein